MEDEVEITGVITLAEKRAEIKAVIVKRDLASADRRVVAIRRGYCHDLHNDEDEGEGSHGRRTFRVQYPPRLSPNWCACGSPCLHESTCRVDRSGTGLAYAATSPGP
jgi:hypothetical protein